MNRAATLALVLFALPAAAPAKDLIGVFEDALHNDPQINGPAGWTRDHNSGIQTQIFSVPNPNVPGTQQLVTAQLPDTIDSTGYQWGLTLRQNVFSWSNWMALKAASHEVAQAEANYAAAEQQLILRVAQAYFNVLTAIDTLAADQTSLEALDRWLDPYRQFWRARLDALERHLDQEC